MKINILSILLGLVTTLTVAGAQDSPKTALRKSILRELEGVLRANPLPGDCKLESLELRENGLNVRISKAGISQNIVVSQVGNDVDDTSTLSQNLGQIQNFPAHVINYEKNTLKPDGASIRNWNGFHEGFKLTSRLKKMPWAKSNQFFLAYDRSDILHLAIAELIPADNSFSSSWNVTTSIVCSRWPQLDASQTFSR